MPIPLFDTNAQRALAEHIMRELERVRLLASPQELACAYKCLGNDYRELQMYGRSIKMYLQSLDIWPSEDVQIRLAKLLINLLGEKGFDEARQLVSTHPPHQSPLAIKRAIEGKQEAIERIK
jgi:tetratricopeptide (TPR) repeat protein